ncbi:hypothetical protein KC316_g7977 [Hortaea werneckii]|nr:hypothetical protein KC324_g9678 [Hortaea werneckii]KAI7582247.1 hypothetical protein KC316_g7977 [Hortaea werneckii]
MWRKLRVNRRKARPTKLQGLQQEVDEEPNLLAASEEVAENDDVAGDKSSREKQALLLDENSEEGFSHPQGPSGEQGTVVGPALDDQEHDTRSNGHSPVDSTASAGDFVSQDEQALRNKAYVQFNGEDADDYTSGPARFVIASDGVKPCAAMLMTLELSAKIKRALRAQHEFAHADTRALHEDRANLKFELELHEAMRRCKRRMFDVAELGTAEADAKHESLSSQMDKLQLLLENAEATRQQIKARMDTHAENLRSIQAEMNVLFEEVFVNGNLLEPFSEPAEEPIEPLSVEEEYRKICQAIAEDDSLEEAEIASFHSCSDHYEPPPLSPTTQARQVLQKDYFSAQRRLGEAQIAFDRRFDTREAEWYANYEAVERGEQAKDASVEDFDARWVIRIQEMTREVIEAEEAMTEAKRALVDAGIDLFQEDQESCFVDTADDGYLGDHEEKLMAQVPGEKIDGWLKEVPDRSSPMSVDGRDADEWDVGDVDIGDSASTIAEGAERRRIDKWRRICGLWE